LSDKTKETVLRKRNYTLPLMLAAVILMVHLCILFATSLDKQLYIQRLYSMEQNAKKVRNWSTFPSKASGRSCTSWSIRYNGFRQAAPGS